MATVIKRDNDGHRFKIPVEMAAEFDRLFNHYTEQDEGSDEYYDTEEAFNNKFEEYMIG